MDCFDVDGFISEIEARPAIWDVRSDAYSDRIQKAKAWEEICLKFVSKFEQMDIPEKNKSASQLQRKWKSLRDCYNRERSKQKESKSGSAASLRKQYKYFQQLSFLSALVTTKPENTEEETRESISPNPRCRRKVCGKRPRPSSIEKAENEVRQNVSESVKKKIFPDEDSDRSFLLSLLPDLNKIHDDIKLDAKGEILNVLKKYKSLTQTSYSYGNQLITDFSQPPYFHSGYNMFPNSTNQPPRYTHSVRQQGYSTVQNISEIPSPSSSVSEPISIHSDQDSVIDDNMFNQN